MTAQLPGYENYAWLWHLASIAFVIILFNFVVKVLLQIAHNRLLAKRRIYQASFMGAVILPLNCALWVFALLNAAQTLDREFSEEVKLDGLEWLYAAGLVVALSWFFLRWKNMLIGHLLASKSGTEASKLDVLDKLLTLTISFVGLILLLEASGYSAATLLTIGGIGAAALGFASKEFIANFFGGLTIYITRPFAIGDLIHIPSSGITGSVEEIGWYLTRIRDLEKQPIYIPNSTFSQAILVTMSQRSHRLIKEEIGLRYCDMEKVPKILEELRRYLDAHEKLDQRQAKRVHFTAYAASSLTLTLFAYTKTVDYGAFEELKQELLFTFNEVLKKHGAEMAFNTTTLDIPDTIKVG